MNEQQVMICERARRAALRSIYALATGFGPPNLPPSLLSRSEVAAAILELPVVTRGRRQRRRVGTDAAARVVLGPFCVPIESSEPVQEAKDIDLAHAALANLAKMARESEHEASSVETWAARIKKHQFPAEVELDWGPRSGDRSFEPSPLRVNWKLARDTPPVRAGKPGFNPESKVVLLATREGIRTGYYDAGGEFGAAGWRLTDDDGSHAEPTHWTDLPEGPPQEGAGT